jgi:hypothetical protein
VTHPFHPLAGRQFVCVGERYNRYGARLLLRIDEDQVLSVPRQWTDVVAPDPEVVIGDGRSLLRVADLLELADLVSRLVGQERQTGVRKDIDAATVKVTVPQASEGVSRKTPIARGKSESREDRELDKDRPGGVVRITPLEAKCYDGKTELTRRPQPSSRRAR